MGDTDYGFPKSFDEFASHFKAPGELPDAIRQRYLQEPYVYGTHAMRQEAVKLGYRPTEAEAARPPAEILDYNVRNDYQTLIQPKAKIENTDSFRMFTQQFADGKAAFEHQLKQDGGHIGTDQYDVTANRLRLGRLWIARRAVNRETQDYLTKFGGWKGDQGNTVEMLTHGPSRVELPGVLDRPFSIARTAGKQSVQLNPLPHGLRNVGGLAYLAGGPEAFGRGTAYAFTGIKPEQLSRLVNTGLHLEYARTIEGPIGKIAGVKEYGQVSNAVLNRLELGYRQALLEHYDQVLGPSKDLSDEYKKADLVRRDLGDYRNVSLFVSGLQGMGGPFVAFRVGTVPAAVGRAIKNNPHRVQPFSRGQQDINEQGGAPPGSELVIGGPVEDFSRAAFDPYGYFTSPATMGPVGQGLQKLIRLRSGQGDSSESLTGQLAREYVPGVGAIEPWAVAGYSAAGQKPPAFLQPFGGLPGAVSPLHAALLSTFGPYYKKSLSGKQKNRVKRSLNRTQ